MKYVLYCWTVITAATTEQRPGGNVHPSIDEKIFLFSSDRAESLFVYLVEHICLEGKNKAKHLVL